MQQTVSDRIRMRMLELNITQADLMRLTGAARGTVSGWFNGMNSPSAKHIGAVCAALKTTPQWLLDGIGPSETSNGAMTNIEIDVYSPGDPIPEGYVAIDYYDDVYVSAGNGYLNIDYPSSKKMLFETALVKQCNVQSDEAKIIHVRGESMQPVLWDGQPISIDTSAKKIFDGEIYAFQVTDDTKIKYLFKWNEQGIGGFKAVSANPDKNRYPDEYYSPDRIECENIQIIGQYWMKIDTRRIRR